MNVFVPESVAANQRTPIYFAVNNAGWATSYIRASVNAGASYNSATCNVGAALKAGYVFIDVANRSRNLLGADGSYPGKSPAAVVDAKAAVRYLRLNDTAMPGSAERIVVNGTSGGGALSSILGAAGNRPEYLPYLAQIGGDRPRMGSELFWDLFVPSTPTGSVMAENFGLSYPRYLADPNTPNPNYQLKDCRSRWQGSGRRSCRRRPTWPRWTRT